MDTSPNSVYLKTNLKKKNANLNQQFKKSVELKGLIWKRTIKSETVGNQMLKENFSANKNISQKSVEKDSILVFIKCLNSGIC